MKNKFSLLFTSSRKLDTDQLIYKKTVISFAVFFFMFALAISGWIKLRQLPRDRMGTNAVVRGALTTNESIFSSLLSDKHLAKSYPKSEAANPARRNGNVGMDLHKMVADFANWNMQVVKSNGDTLHITLADLKKLPKTEVVFNFKCIEGWSQITYWGGVKFADFIKAYGLEKETNLKYIGLRTMDEKYYVGIDMASALHPQTILCYELNAQPLPVDQGYPLRLIIPVKYGVKHLKTIGTLVFSNDKPRDYWAERGYDYFTGL